jgi:putative sigma-54 modulation protein
MMNTQIQSIHFKASDELQSFVLDKAEKLEKFSGRIQDCRVTLSLDKDEHRRNKTVEVALNLPGKRLVAIDSSETFEAAATEAIEDMKRQLAKYKTANSRKRKQGQAVDEDQA